MAVERADQTCALQLRVAMCRSVSTASEWSDGCLGLFHVDRYPLAH